MPGTADRELALTASTGRPPRWVVNVSCRCAPRRAARRRSMSDASRRAAASRRRHSPSSGDGAVEDAAAAVERALERRRQPAQRGRLDTDRQAFGETGRLLAMGTDLGAHLDRDRDGRLEPLETRDVEHSPADHQRDVVAEVERAAGSRDGALLEKDTPPRSHRRRRRTSSGSAAGTSARANPAPPSKLAWPARRDWIAANSSSSRLRTSIAMSEALATAR